MTVRALAANGRAVLAGSPALLSFTSTDRQPKSSQLTLTVSNPGSRPLQWSLAPVQGLSCNLLAVSSTSGTVPPGSSEALSVTVQSLCLLPGAYTNTLTFAANGAIDSSQAVNLSVV